MQSEGNTAFVNATDAATRPASSIEDLERAMQAAQAETKTVMWAYLHDRATEGQLEIALRAEAEARYLYQGAKARAEMDALIPQMMATARQKYRETASLRDPRSYVRGKG